MGGKIYSPVVPQNGNSRAIANSMKKSKGSNIFQASKPGAIQRFVLRVGYDAGLAASKNDIIASSQKTVKATGDLLSGIDKDTVNTTKIHDYPTFSLTDRQSSVTAKTPVHLVGHGQPGGKIGGNDASTIAQNIISTVRSNHQELEFIKLYSCFGMNDENTTPSSTAKFKTALSSESITGVPVYGAKGLLIPRKVNTAQTDLVINVIPRRYSSYAFGKKETISFFKTKLLTKMDSTTDGTWEAPKSGAESVIRSIVLNLNNIILIPAKLLMKNAAKVLSSQQLLDSDPTTGTINFDAVPSGEPGAGDKMGAAAKGAKLSLNTVKSDISGQTDKASIVSEIDGAINEIDAAETDLQLNIDKIKFKGEFLKDILV